MAQDFGTLLRRHRLAAGLSQEALAERARMSTNGVGALENGWLRIPREVAQKFHLGSRLGLWAAFM